MGQLTSFGSLMRKIFPPPDTSRGEMSSVAVKPLSILSVINFYQKCSRRRQATTGRSHFSSKLGLNLITCQQTISYEMSESSYQCLSAFCYFHWIERFGSARENSKYAAKIFISKLINVPILPMRLATSGINSPAEVRTLQHQQH